MKLELTTRLLVKIVFLLTMTPTLLLKAFAEKVRCSILLRGLWWPPGTVPNHHFRDGGSLWKYCTIRNNGALEILVKTQSIRSHWFVLGLVVKRAFRAIRVRHLLLR